MKFKPIYWISVCFGILMIVADTYFFWKTRLFWPVMILALTIMWLSFWIDFFRNLGRQKEIELQFVEFVRSLSESIKSGISIPRSIMNVTKKDFAALNPYVRKLANQIEWGIPTRKALTTFSLDTNNNVIKRAISIIVEAEQSGGDITDILTAVVDSVINVKKMKEERKASVFSQIVQGYVVFFIFIGIMLLLQLWLFPKLGNLSGAMKGGVSSFGSLFQGGSSPFNLDTTFFGLIMIQGFFAGMMVGKFSEGSLKQGLLHSLILMTASAFIITIAKGTI
ncbi:MAG: type II secretion system F family protein [Nanoarchaeota archaeon]